MATDLIDALDCFGVASPKGEEEQPTDEHQSDHDVVNGQDPCPRLESRYHKTGQEESHRHRPRRDDTLMIEFCKSCCVT